MVERRVARAVNVRPPRLQPLPPAGQNRYHTTGVISRAASVAASLRYYSILYDAILGRSLDHATAAVSCSMLPSHRPPELPAAGKGGRTIARFLPSWRQRLQGRCAPFCPPRAEDRDERPSRRLRG